MGKDTILKVEVTTSDNRKLVYDTPSNVTIDIWCCDGCNKTLDPDWAYCPYCGNDIRHSENGRYKAGHKYAR